MSRGEPFSGILEIAGREPLHGGESGTAWKVRDAQGRAYKLRVCESAHRARRLEGYIRRLGGIYPGFHGRDRRYLLSSFVAAPRSAGAGFAAGNAWHAEGVQRLYFQIGKLHALAHRCPSRGRAQELDRRCGGLLRQLAREGALPSREAAEAIRLYEGLRQSVDYEFRLDLRDSTPRNFVRGEEGLYFVDEEGIDQIKGLGLARLTVRGLPGDQPGGLLGELTESVRAGYEETGARFPSLESLRLLALYDLATRIEAKLAAGRPIAAELVDLGALLRPARPVRPAGRAARPSRSERPAGRAADPAAAVPARGAHVCLATLEYPPTTGGVAVSARRLVRYLVEEGFEVEVFATAETPWAGGAAGAVPEDGARIHRLPQYDPPQVTAALMLEAILLADRRAPFDLFHGFFLPLAYPCLHVARQGQRPVVASIRGDDAVSWLADPVRRQIVASVLRRAAWVTSVSSDLLANVAPLADISGRSSLILNAIDGAGTARWRLGDHNRGVVGTLGKFRDKKEIPLLVEAYAGVAPELRRRLLLAGYFDGETVRRQVLQSIRENGLESEVEITGWVPREAVCGRLLEMGVFVQCSRHEGLANAMLEAGAAGVPLVTTSVGGARDVLVQGESALLVPPGDARGLAEAISTVLADEALARRLSRGAREVTAGLLPEREKASWLALYRRLLAGRPAPGGGGENGRPVRGHTLP